MMVVVYLAYTYKATEWRISIRKQMNESDTDASTKAVDSLLNYETVKYFGAERRETERYDAPWRATSGPHPDLHLARGAQLRPGVIFTIGMTVVMALAARDIMAGGPPSAASCS
jgi:ATP-binding cassette subfamily B protein